MNYIKFIRRLNTKDAVIIGLGSMIGAGIFTVAGPAVFVAGSGLLISVFLAGIIAFLNALSMAQLASLYPHSGGVYLYAQKQLGDLWGFLAGWGFIIGKIASCTAMALTFGLYAAPNYPRITAISMIILLSLINYFGIKKTAFVTKILLFIVLFSLAVVLFSAFAGGTINISRIIHPLEKGGLAGIFQATGLMFFAFAGYARIATLGEEVLSPEKTIPKAIFISLGITLGLYILLMAFTLLSLETEKIALSKTPLALVVESSRYFVLAPIVRLGASFASLSVLLSLMAGIGRTIFAMASNNDLPAWFSTIHPKYHVPYRAELSLCLIICLLLIFTDIRSVIGFSSFAILFYYTLANISAWKLHPSERKIPRWTSLLGAFACLAIAAHLPLNSIFIGLIIFGVGLVFYLYLRKI